MLHVPGMHLLRVLIGSLGVLLFVLSKILVGLAASPFAGLHKLPTLLYERATERDPILLTSNTTYVIRGVFFCGRH